MTIISFPSPSKKMLLSLKNASFPFSPKFLIFPKFLLTLSSSPSSSLTIPKTLSNSPTKAPNWLSKLLFSQSLSSNWKCRLESSDRREEGGRAEDWRREEGGMVEGWGRELGGEEEEEGRRDCLRRLFSVMYS